MNKMDYGINQLQNDLKDMNTSLFISKWITDRIPFVFGDDIFKYILWKNCLAQAISVDPNDIIFTGSACVGFSLNPNKSFKIFDDYSDFDIAIISQHYFDMAWFEILHLGSKWHSLYPDQQSSLIDHQSKYIYWGTIATDKILPILSFSRFWEPAITRMRNMSPSNGREIKIRIYKDCNSFRTYNISNLKKLSEKLQENEND